MKDEEKKDLLLGLSALAVFGALKRDPVIGKTMEALGMADSAKAEDRVSCISDIAASLYHSGGDMTEYVLNAALDDENAYLTAIAKGLPVSEEMEYAVRYELSVLTKLGTLTARDLLESPACEPACGEAAGGTADGSTAGGTADGEAAGGTADGKATEDARRGAGNTEALYVPEWHTSKRDIADAYFDMIGHIPTKGYGVYRKYNAFKLDDGRLAPVKHADPQSLDTLYGYEEERKKVFDNTKVLAEGGRASNVLLYGDAGTGKSSTIKACASHFAGAGVRLIEFSKDEIPEIPKIIDEIYDTPLKFIFYIDDLSFSGEDDDFCYLKGILEGNITGKSDNVVIYATSNRRHLVRELAEDREGTDIHINDTLQQTMSLSARFGLIVTFSKPGKDLYLHIVKNLAQDYGVDLPEKVLFAKAEQFAIRQNGRSPRTAKQFLELLSADSGN